MEENTILASLAALQVQVASMQSNLTFLLEAVQELKKENADRRNTIDTFATTTRDRLGKIESDLGLGRWAITIIVGGILALGSAKIYHLAMTDGQAIEQIIKK